MVNNKKLKGHVTVSELFRNPLQRKQSQHTEGNLHSNITFQWKKIHRSEWAYHSKTTRALLQNKEASPRADTKIQILLPPKESNSETFREERLVSKKKCMIRNIANPLLASALLPDMFCNKNNAISPEAIGGRQPQFPLEKSFWHGFHQLSIKTTRMAAMWEAKVAAWEKTSVCAARKHSSSTYKDKSSTLIRRSSTIKWGTIADRPKLNRLKCTNYHLNK